jgi:hypothetical protein
MKNGFSVLVVCLLIASITSCKKYTCTCYGHHASTNNPVKWNGEITRANTSSVSAESLCISKIASESTSDFVWTECIAQ